MALLILLVLWIRRSSAATAYRLQAGIWLAGIPLQVAGGHYYPAFLHGVIGVALLALASACAECGQLRATAARSAPVQVSITNAGPVHLHLPAQL